MAQGCCRASAYLRPGPTPTTLTWNAAYRQRVNSWRTDGRETRDRGRGDWYLSAHSPMARRAFDRASENCDWTDSQLVHGSVGGPRFRRSDRWMDRPFHCRNSSGIDLRVDLRGPLARTTDGARRDLRGVGIPRRAKRLHAAGRGWILRVR